MTAAPESVELRAKLDSLISGANAAKLGGNFALAAELLKKALELAPGDSDLRERSADLHFAAGNYDLAAEQSKALMAEHHTVAVEEKYAKAVLAKADAEYKKRVSVGPVPVYERKKPLVAALFSLVPGFGQIYCGDVVRGTWIFLIVVLSWFLFSAFAPAMPMTGTLSSRLSSLFNQINFGAVMFLLIAVCVHIYAAVEAVLKAKKLSA